MSGNELLAPGMANGRFRLHGARAPGRGRHREVPCGEVEACHPDKPGNFRLLNRPLTQIERTVEINALQQVTKIVVEAARENLVIGQA